MKLRLRTSLITGAILAALLAVLAVGYRAIFSMDVARSYELAGSVPAPRVLIATQGSQFKDSVVAGVVAYLRSRDTSISVIDVSELKGATDDVWDAVVLVHTWEMRKPPPAVREFVDRVHDKTKLVVLTTSGAGGFKLAGVDVISSASRDEDVPAKVQAIIDRLDAVLARRAATSAAPGS